MDLPAIAIVTPTLNQGAFIRETIESVLAQGYPGLEYLVLDAGSTDGTLDILRSYGERIRWISGADTGQTNAINKGWGLTRAKIISWLNSDDLLYPSALHQVGQFFRDHPQVDIVYGDCDYIDEHGAFLRPYPTRAFVLREMVLDTLNTIPQPAAFIRRSILQSAGLLDETLKYVMDFDYWLRAGVDHEIRYVPAKWAALRLHSTAKSVASLGKFADELVYIYQKLFQREDLPPEIRDIERKAMGEIYARAMDCAFWAGDLGKARGFALRAWKYQPLRPRRLWLYLALGQLGYRQAQQRIDNPYLLKSR